MKNKTIACLVASLLAFTQGFAQAREEFNGPFASWADVKKQFGAKGNGKDDDTKAIQNALDQLTVPPTNFNMGKGAYTVVYLPAGTYCISSTLQLKGKIGVSIIGEDPSRTIIRWTGKDSGNIFLANGSAYYRISRFTWDANGRKGVEAIGIHWINKWNDGKTRSFAALNIEVSDNIFIGGFRCGISGGTPPGPGTGANDSEISIRRCVFKQCTGPGIDIYGFNAIDYWIWDCSFLDCWIGVNCNRGIYHLYRSFFSGSKASDLINNNGYYLSVRGCYFENGHSLALDAGMSCNPFKRIYQDNIVINPKVLPVEFYHLGKMSFMGNQFSATVDTTYKFSINTKSWCPGIFEVLSLHNTYAYKTPIRIASSPQRLYSVGDRYQPAAWTAAVIRRTAKDFLKTMDPIPRKVERKIFEVPAGANAVAIQSILDQAAKLNGQRPIVHFAIDHYIVDRTLVIPAGSDIQLAGEGMISATIISPRDQAPLRRQPVFLVKGPSYITIRDLQIGSQSGRGQPSGIIFENVDQPSAQAHLDQVYSPQADTSLIVNGMDHLYIQKDNSFFSSGNYIAGGNLTQQGKGEARVCCYGGQFALLTVKGNASFLAKDCWWEGAARVPLNLEGSGNISIDGAMISPSKADSLPTVRVGKFNGNISLLNMYLMGGILPQPDNPDLNLLAWNIHFYYKMNPVDFLKDGGSYKGAFLGLNAQCFRADDPGCKSILSINDQLHNVPDANPFLDTMTTQDRESRPVLFGNLPEGVSNIFISRVSFGVMSNGMVFNAD